MSTSTRSLCLVVAAACGDNAEPSVECGWPQWGGAASHAGASCARGQPLERELANVVIDPFTELEFADTDGKLLVHYQVPLVAGDDVFAMQKGGTYTPCGDDCRTPGRLNSQTWIEKRYRWEAGALVEQWSFSSDWKPEPSLEFEPMFQPALAGEHVAIPGLGGSVFLVDRETGTFVRRIEPAGSLDADTYVAGGIAVGADGTIVYTTLSLDNAMPLTADARGGAVVVVAPDGTTRSVDFATLIPGAPAGDAACETSFGPEVALPLPPPPNPDGTPATPPLAPCGRQRPAINVTPAIGADGRIFLVSRAHLNDRYAYVLALEPDLSLAWATSLRDILDDGCGITLPADGATGSCRAGATTGVDPATNARPAGRADDRSSSSPTALPDGGVLYGAATFYNGERGHLLRFDRDGAAIASYVFGWDITPAVIPTATDFEVVLKHNHYGEDPSGVDWGPFEMVRLDAMLRPIWITPNTETSACIRDANGDVICFEGTNPGGFEWCINAPAVDADGTTFANAEDGYLYALAADGSVRDRFFLDRAAGAAYTPLSLDDAGRVYAMNNGRLFVVGAR